jgi:FkbM family methyltransferase
MIEEAFGARAPGWLDHSVIAATSRLPDNWLGLRLAIALRRVVTTHLAEDGGLDVVRWGLRMRLHPRRNGCEKNALFTPQMYEPAERVELAAQIEKAKAANQSANQGAGRAFVFIDVGANVGLFSLFVAARAGPNAQIVAIEPEPQNLERLRFNVAANPGIPIRVVALALGDRKGLVALEVDDRDRGGTRTRALTSMEGEELNADSHVPLVDCCTLLDLLRQEEISHIDALKIDVEGAEDRVLEPFFRDAPQTLWPSLIIIEDGRDSWRTDLFSVFSQCGYTVAIRTKLNVALRLVQT